MEKFRWGYIGTGSIACSTAKSILKGNHTITAAYNRTYERAVKFAEKFGAKAYRTAEELISSGEVDAIYIATPHTSHVEYAVAALKAHIPVLCEKPVGVSSADVELLIKTAKENNTYFAEAMWTWYSDTALTVKRWVNEGQAGKINKVEIHHCFPGLSMKEDSRVRDPMTAGGALLDIGIYPITYCYNIFGYPDRIRCEGTIEKGIDTKEKVTLTYGDLDCELYMSLYYPKEKCVIKGDKGTVRLPGVFHAAPVAVLLGKASVKLGFGKTTYLNEFTRCAEEIKQGKKESAYVPFSSTLDCMRIMDECRRQMGLVYPFEK